MPQQILRALQPFLPQALVAPRHEGPRMMMTIASSTLLLYLNEQLRPRVQHVQPQSLAASRCEEPWMMTTIASSTAQPLQLQALAAPRREEAWMMTSVILPRERMPEGCGRFATQKKHSHSYRGTYTMSSSLRKPSDARTRAKMILLGLAKRAACS